MRAKLPLLWAPVLASLLSAPAGAALREFTGTVAITDQTLGLGLPPLSVNGSGIGVSSAAGTNEVGEFTDVTGFTGTSPASPGRLVFTGIGPAAFAGIGGLHGPMPVRGFAQNTTVPSMPIVFPLTENGTVGLGGTILANLAFGAVDKTRLTPPVPRRRATARAAMPRGV